MSEDEYGYILITQSSSNNGGVSLEDNGDNSVVKKDKYLNISDFEEDGEMEQRIRYAI